MMARAFAGPRRNPAASNATPSGLSQGSPGGKPRAATSRPGTRMLAFGDEMYLWVLVILEVAAIALLRKKFRRYHGG